MTKLCGREEAGGGGEIDCCRKLLILLRLPLILRQVGDIFPLRWLLLLLLCCEVGGGEGVLLVRCGSGDAEPTEELEPPPFDADLWIFILWVR